MKKLIEGARYNTDAFNDGSFWKVIKVSKKNVFFETDSEDEFLIPLDSSALAALKILPQDENKFGLENAKSLTCISNTFIDEGKTHKQPGITIGKEYALTAFSEHQFLIIDNGGFSTWVPKKYFKVNY